MWAKRDVGEKSVYGSYKNIEMEVYPINDSPKNGWEYTLRGSVGELGKNHHGEYDSLTESSNGDDHASSLKEVKGWAENTAKDFVEGN